MEPTRAEHLAWCKKRAIELLDAGRDPAEAYASMGSDLEKHDETRGHSGISLGMQMLMAGLLDEPQKMREFINGFN